MFVDYLKIYAKAGDGGDGCVSFRREKFVPKGGPDGGDGGRGGDVIIEVDPHTDSLRALVYRQNYKAERGQNGMGQKKSGKSGKPVILRVPVGTVVHRALPPDAGFADDGGGTGTEFIMVQEDEDGEEIEFIEGAEDDGEIFEVEPGAADSDDEAETEEDDADEDLPVGDEVGEMVADLTHSGERFILCQGGIGGLGNQHFATSTNQAPIETRPAGRGEEGWYYLELRQIADAGLVGFPNAGKSTLLGAVSNAHPKVASYPFTTLKPSVGVVEFPGYQRATVADIPGLIEGAHRNVGLGHEFLRHITRCRLLLFVVDTAGVDGRDPISDLQALRTEIKLYNEELSKRPWLIVANKMDLEAAQENFAHLRQRFPRQEIIPISADTGLGLDVLKERLRELAARRAE
jgi:GTP-binding protein